MLDIDDIADVIASAVREASEPLLARIDALEKRELLLPEKGDPGEPGVVDMDAVQILVERDVERLLPLAVERAIAALPAPEKGEPGEPGRNADPAELAALVETAVKSAVDALPAPKDGEAGKDGLGLANALIDRDGALVLTMTDGTAKSLGRVIGKDGDPGKDGETFALDDFDIDQYDDGRTLKFKFTRGEVMHSFEFALPVPIYRGVFKEGESYERGDLVTWGGSLWHCDKGTSEKPNPDSWTLAAKRGRDGKDAGK